MTNIAILSSKGQLVIPKSLRNVLGLYSGSELALELKNNILEIHPIKGNISKFFNQGKNVSLTEEEQKNIDGLISKAVMDNDKY